MSCRDFAKVDSVPRSGLFVSPFTECRRFKRIGEGLCSGIQSFLLILLFAEIQEIAVQQKMLEVKLIIVSFAAPVTNACPSKQMRQLNSIMTVELFQHHSTPLFNVIMIYPFMLGIGEGTWTDSLC
jgi:hypothetical protein